MPLKNFKIDCISDTHNRHKHFTMPGGDLLIHAGDASLGGKVSELLNFLDWYAKQPYGIKIFVPGNHDWICEKNPALMKDEARQRGIHLLNDEALLVKSVNDPSINIKVWGSPIQPEFCNWAFNRTRGDEIARHWAMIPDDTEILITHGPAMFIRDWVLRMDSSYDNVGCWDLANTIRTRLKKLKLHVFGHIHYGEGHTYKDGITYVNASVLDEQYYPLKSKPIKVVRDVNNDYLVENEPYE